MALADEVALTASPQTIAYVSMMRHCIRGNYDWECLSGRYPGWT
ncbi:hypothetical protein ACIBKX_40620 [Streptomyces sp. NPDC050658]